MAIRLLTLIVSIFLSVHISPALSQRSCYYPKGRLVPLDTPCNPQAKHSMCCGATDICLSNGLCYVANINRLHRGSCTDSSWDSDICSTTCTNDGDFPYGWADVVACSNSTAPGMFYCGYGNENRCAAGNGQTTFSLPDGAFADQRNASLLEAKATPTPSAGGVIATSITKSAQESASADTFPGTSCPSGAGAQAGIGVGIGLPLSLGLATVLYLFFRERRRTKEVSTEMRYCMYESRRAQELLTENQRAFVRQQLVFDRNYSRQATNGPCEADSKPRKIFHEVPA